ncbi:MAG: TetR/AcrR family transcriptional regulator [Terracidiphilus sp.]
MSTENAKKTKTLATMPRSVKLLWGVAERGSRGPKSTLSAERIARAAIRVADAEGLDAVSMQRIAREIHLTTMALYRYFPGKTALIDLMIETAGGPVPGLGREARGWRSRLKDWTRSCSAIYQNHPWFLQATSARRRILGPNELAWLDAAVGLLSASGLSAREAHQAFLVLIGHVRSHAEFTGSGGQGLPAKQWVSVTAKLLEQHSGQFPALAAAIKSGLFGSGTANSLDFGIECILDGIESLVARRRRPC